MTAATTETSEAAVLAVSVERKPGSQVTLSVEAPASEVERAVAVALRRFAGQMRVPGFRPGKAPSAVVERQVGWESLRQEALEFLVPVLYMRALDQEGIEPVGEPEIDLDASKVERDQPLHFNVTVTVKPTVELGDYRALRVDPIKTEIGESEVDAALEEVRRRHAELVAVDRPAQLGDLVRCSLEMRHGDELVSGGEGQVRDVELERDQLIAGLADGIVGMAPESDRTFTITLPDDFPREELRGKEVSVICAMKEVKERSLSALDDSLAVLDGHGPTVQELRAFYLESLTEAAKSHDVEQFEAAVLELFRDSLKLEVPQVMVDAEIDRQLRDLEYRFSSMGISWEQYLQMTSQTDAQLRGERRDNAVTRVKLELGLDALAAADGIEVDETEVEREQARVSKGQKLTASQKRRLHQMTHLDLARQAAGARLMEIARGEA